MVLGWAKVGGQYKYRFIGFWSVLVSKVPEGLSKTIRSRKFTVVE